MASGEIVVADVAVVVVARFRRRTLRRPLDGRPPAPMGEVDHGLSDRRARHWCTGQMALDPG